MTTPTQTRLELSQIMDRHQTNLYGNVHGGNIMKFVDDIAGAVAARFSGGPAVTAAMDEMLFLAPVRVGDVLTAKSQVNWAGRTSMEIGIRVETTRWDEVGAPVHVGTAFMVFVAVDADGTPRSVPKLTLETDDDARRHRAAELRREHRLARRKAIQELGQGQSALAEEAASAADAVKTAAPQQ